MKGIRGRARQLGAFVVLPAEPCSQRGLRARLSRVRMQWEELTWGLPERAWRIVAWIFGRPVRRWRRSQSRYDVGGALTPMTVWEMRRALKGFDPHAPIVIDAHRADGHAVTLDERALTPRVQAVVLTPGRLPYKELATRTTGPDFSYLE